jgi:hypothetical protein
LILQNVPESGVQVGFESLQELIALHKEKPNLLNTSADQK